MSPLNKIRPMTDARKAETPIAEAPIAEATNISGLSEDGLSQDGLIGHRLRLIQPQQGYRAGSDAVFLAAAVQSTQSGSATEMILDAGCGAGAVSLCLAYRLRQARIDGLEVQPDLAELYDRNAANNDFGARLRGHCGDISAPPDVIKNRQYDQVVSNPPFFQNSRSQASPHAAKDRAHREGELSTADWLAACLRRLKSCGVLTLIQAAERLPDVLPALSGVAGDIVIYPVWSRPGGPASRVIVRALKGRRGPARLQAGIVVHDNSGARSATANQVLRLGETLEITL
jgi:tRNA1(Val) A37 N6-methylase TrmN6